MTMRLYLACTLCAFTLLAACSDDETSSDSTGSGAGTSTSSTTGGGGSGGVATGGAGGMMQPFTVTSSAFEDGGSVPLAHECGPPLQGPGMNLSPELSWTAGPAETASYAVVVRDIDAMIPAYPEGIVHWVIYDIPASVLQLPEGIMANYEVGTPAGAKQANIQDSGFFGYFGMCSPNSINSYQFTVHAMPEATVPGVTMGSTEQDIAVTIESTSIAQTSITGES